MEVHMTNDDLRKPYAEVLDMLRFIGTEYKSLVPAEELRLFESECDKKYLYQLEADETAIDDRQYSEEALAIIAYLNLRYWCKDDKEKKYYKDIYLKNFKDKNSEE